MSQRTVLFVSMYVPDKRGVGFRTVVDVKKIKKL